MRWTKVWLGAGLVALACAGKTQDSESEPRGRRDPKGGSAGAADGGYLPPTNDGCFAKGTRIATASGSIAIEDVRVGDRVLGFDLGRRTVVDELVTEVFVHRSRPVGLLPTSQGALRVTANHPIYDATQRSFVPAGAMTAPSRSLSLASSWSTAAETLGAFQPLAEPETVYNLTVAHVHTYFAEGVLVHNKPRCGYPGDPLDCPCSYQECPPLVTAGTGAGGFSAGGLGGVGGLTSSGVADGGGGGFGPGGAENGGGEAGAGGAAGER